MLSKAAFVCSVILSHGFTVTCDQLNASLLNKSIDFLKKQTNTDPKLLFRSFLFIFHYQAPPYIIYFLVK